MASTTCNPFFHDLKQFAEDLRCSSLLAGLCRQGQHAGARGHLLKSQSR